jgi:hypothetical protein
LGDKAEQRDIEKKLPNELKGPCPDDVAQTGNLQQPVVPHHCTPVRNDKYLFFFSNFKLYISSYFRIDFDFSDILNFIFPIIFDFDSYY